jgi:pimeloyl-ACP methyl ester carboxylesterase
MAEDLKNFMEKEGLEEASIMGHSMGGKTAMTIASQYPEKVTKLIVVDIAPKPYEPGHEQIFKALRALPINEIESRQEAREFLSDYIDEQGIRLFLLKNLSRKKEGGYRWKMNLEGIYNNYSNILSSLPEDAKFEGSTLFINGKRSHYIQKDDKDLIRKHFPKAQLLTLKNAGHWVHVDQADALREAVVRFLGDS